MDCPTPVAARTMFQGEYLQFVSITNGLSVEQRQLVLSQVAKFAKAVRSDASCSDLLSGRELDVLVLVANGYSRKEISNCLKISVNTAARHIANIYQKLSISSVAEATQYALAKNLVSAG